ncbi:hypothetical protein GCM10010433_62050 [Streptomyces pulveraceus]
MARSGAEAALYRGASARPEKLEREAEQRYPGVFERLDTERATAGAAALSWCRLPVARVHEVLARHCTSAGTGIEGASPTARRSVDAARPASIGAWRAAGRHMVHPDDGLVPWPQEAECEGSDELPVDLPGRWPLFGLYVVFLSPNPVVRAEGGFCTWNGTGRSSGPHCSSHPIRSRLPAWSGWMSGRST